MNPEIIKMLTYYRAVPAMYRALTARGSVKERAELDLLHHFGPKIGREELQCVLAKYKNWIIYTMSDMAVYTSKILDEVETEKSYCLRMKEEAQLVTEYAPFDLGIHPVRILDIGAGASPYAEHFAKANGHGVHYISVDKRESGLRHTPVPGARMSYYVGDVMKLTKEKWNLTGWEPNVLFLANFLHCLEDIDGFFKHILSIVDTLKIIKILEVKPDTDLDYLFDYHMFEHCRGQRFTAFSCLREHPQLVESLGDYHEMTTIVL